MINSVNSSTTIQNQIYLCAESKDILQRIKKVHSGCFFRSDKVLNQKLKNISPIELTKVIHCFLHDLQNQGLLDDPVKAMDRLAALLPLDKMQEAVKDNMGNALEEAKNLFQEAKYYLNATQPPSPSIHSRISALLDRICALIDNLIAGFGIGSIFKSSDNEFLAEQRSQKIMMLLSLFSMLATLLLPLCGPAVGGMIVGGTLLFITVLSIIWPMIKPRPSQLPANSDNWTKQVTSGGFVAQGRKESLDEIANILKMNRHALLVGPSRVGKSLTAKAFALAVARGDYPELKGKTVFRINVADLIEKNSSGSFFGGSNSILTQISDAMGRHRNGIILVLDELHMACKNNEKICDLLKTYLDKDGQFPHVIGITTEEELKYIQENQAFANRFDRVNIVNTAREETLGILAETVLTSSSKPFLEEGALDTIYEKSSPTKDPQPSGSLKILTKCIRLTEKTQVSPTGKKIQDLFNKITSLRAQAAAQRNRKRQIFIQISDLEKQLAELHKIYKQEKIEQINLFKTKDVLDRVTRETYQTALKIAELAPSKINPKQIKLFILLRHFLSQTLQDHIKTQSKSLGIKAVIDRPLIEEAVTA